MQLFTVQKRYEQSLEYKTFSVVYCGIIRRNFISVAWICCGWRWRLWAAAETVFWYFVCRQFICREH